MSINLHLLELLYEQWVSAVQKETNCECTVLPLMCAQTLISISVINQEENQLPGLQ